MNELPETYAELRKEIKSLHGIIKNMEVRTANKTKFIEELEYEISRRDAYYKEINEKLAARYNSLRGEIKEEWRRADALISDINKLEA